MSEGSSFHKPLRGWDTDGRAWSAEQSNPYRRDTRNYRRYACTHTFTTASDDFSGKTWLFTLLCGISRRSGEDANHAPVTHGHRLRL